MRHEDLGLTEEEAAFYDALASGVEDIKADPQHKKLAGEPTAAEAAGPPGWSTRPTDG